jgi:small conductance mechanosensitive channel
MSDVIVLHGVRIVGIVVVAFIAQKMLGSFIQRLVHRVLVHANKTTSDAIKKREDTLVTVFDSFAYFGIWCLALFLVLSEAGLNILPFIATAGIVGIAVGFGGQYLVRDIITGLIMLFEDQYRIGDIVCLDDTCGMVEDTTLRKTTLRDRSGVAHHVPHGDVRRVSNMSSEIGRINIKFGISYDADIDRVADVINRVGSVLAVDPAWREHIKKVPSFAQVKEFGESSITIRVSGETAPGKQWDVSSELRRRIRDAFAAEGITIPYPQIVVHQASLIRAPTKRTRSSK